MRPPGTQPLAWATACLVMIGLGVGAWVVFGRPPVIRVEKIERDIAKVPVEEKVTVKRQVEVPAVKTVEIKKQVPAPIAPRVPPMPARYERSKEDMAP